MRPFRIDLRLRIAAALATACITVVSGLGFGLYLVSEETQEAVEEQIISDEMESLIQRARRGAEIASEGPNLRYYVLRSSGDRDNLPPALRGLAPGRYQIGQGAREMRVAVRDAEGARYIVVYNAGPHEARQTRFRDLLLIALAVIVLVSLALGYWLAGVLTRQLSDLATRVGKLKPDELHAPLERADHDREVGALARALDDYQARIVDMMKRAQEFATNTSHELRTPLTAIRTSCELLAAERSLSPSAQARVAMIERAAGQMTETIEALLLLARLHQPVGPRKVALRRCVDEAAMAYREEMARKGVAFEVTIPETEVVEVDHGALRLVLTNLIKNASRYTDRGYVRVSYRALRLTVADSGPGIADHHLPRLFERYYRAGKADEGLGLGLAIVERICDHFGWRIEVRSRPGEGSAFTLVLA